MPFPLIIVAVAGLGVTRMALFALEFHEDHEEVRYDILDAPS